MLKIRGAAVGQTREASEHGIFVCGNILSAHNLVNFVSEETDGVGRCATKCVLDRKMKLDFVEVSNGESCLRVSAKVDKNFNGYVKIFFRVTDRFKNYSVVNRVGGIVYYNA